MSDDPIPRTSTAPADRHRTAELTRSTSESRVHLRLDLDGTGQAQVRTGVRFYDHMLASLSKHSASLDEDWQGRLDFEYTPAGLPWLSKIQWGMRYVDRKASDYDAQHYAFAGNLGIPISAVPLDYVLRRLERVLTPERLLLD